MAHSYDKASMTSEINLGIVSFSIDQLLKQIRIAMELAEYIRINSTILFEGVATKSDASPVTVADFCCQILLNEFISSLSSKHEFCVISEESSAVLRKDEKIANLCCQLLNDRLGQSYSLDKIYELLDYGKCQSSTSFWVIDPIDGTKGFLRNGHYAICLAFVVDSAPLFGILACPNTQSGIILYAQSGLGCYQIDSTGVSKEIRTKNENISDCVLVESFESSPLKLQFVKILMQHLNINTVPLLIDSQVKYALVANGTANIYIRYPSGKRQEKIWDHAAGYLIVQEAGGITTDFDGKHLYFAGEDLNMSTLILSASNSHLHAAVLNGIRHVVGEFQ